MRLKMVPPINRFCYSGKAYGRNNSIVGEIRYQESVEEYSFYPDISTTTDSISAQTLRELAKTLKKLNDTL